MKNQSIRIKKNFRGLIIASLLILVFPIYLSAQDFLETISIYSGSDTIYVKQDGTGDVTTIQAGIDIAQNGNVVLVYPGTYIENINIDQKNITVASLFLTTQDTTFISQTIIDGNQNGHVVTFENGVEHTAVLTGFTITNGYAQGSWPNCSGGGISCYNSSPSFEYIIITGNRANDYGGGICCMFNSSPSFKNITITDNSANADKGGGGIYCYDNSSPSLENVTITGNISGGINCQYQSSPSIVNSIVSNNTGNFGIFNWDGNPTITYSDFFNNQSGNFYGVNNSIGVNVTTNANGDNCDKYFNIQMDPLFVDPANGDYHLTENSPCIDAGDPSSPYDPDETIADMGAFYFDPGGTPISTTDAATDVNTTSATLNGTVNPNELSTTVIFEYGETASYGSQITADQSPVSGTTDVTVSANLSGLSDNTEYHYRVVATNSKGTTNGVDLTFTTLQAGNAPTTTTEAATDVNTTSATLNGTVNPNELSTTVIFEYGETTSYGDQITAEQSPLTGTSNVSVSANLTGLSDNTEYHYRVVATNSVETTYGTDQTFTTLQAGSAPTTTTDAATDVNTTSATLNGTVNPNELSTTVIFEYGETTSYGDQITAEQSPLTGTSNVSVSANLSELSDNTEYHYRVVATNSKGTTNGSDQSFTTQQAGSAPVATTNTPESVTTGSALLKGTVNPGDLSTTVIFEYGTTDSYGNQITATESPVSGMADVSVSASLTGLEDGTTYHYRVTATNSIGTEYGSDQTFETEINYPATYSLSTTQSFPTKASAEDYLATDYRLFGLPGNSNELIRNHLSGNQGENWEVYLDNGEASNYLVKYDGGNNFRLSTGKGFWMIHKGNVGVNKSVSTAVLNSNNEVEIPLQDGWNIITNPLNVAMDWNVIKTYNQITEPVWKYEGGFSQATDFQPYKCYYFYNSGNLSVLKFYYKPAALAKSVAKNAESGWQITLQLLENGIRRDNIELGVRESAESGADRFDLHKPRDVGSGLGIYCHRTEWNRDFPVFYSDYKPEFTEVESWEFTVDNAQKQAVRMSAEGIETVPVEFDVLLIRRRDGKIFDLRRSAGFDMAETTNDRYILIVGTAIEAQQLIETLIPLNFSLAQNYPNPFNPSTTIAYQLPKTSHVILSIYDISGRLVTTLVNEHKEAGYYSAVWNAVNVSSGLYLYVFEAEGFRSVRKCLLVK